MTPASRFAHGLASSTLLLVLSGCTGGDALDAQLEGCGFVVGGVTPRTALYAPDSCYRDCLGSGSCEDLEGVLCRDALALALRCDERCAFRCDDDSLLGVERVCDGFDDCAEGEDEAGCVPFACADGSGSGTSPRRCDGRSQCADQSDETGCPGTVRCATGRRDGGRGPARRCDGRAECLDASDEEGCGRFTLTCDV